LCSPSRTTQHFIEPEGSTPCSQEPSTGPCPKPYQSNPHYHILSKIHFNIIHRLRLGLSSGLFPFGFHTNILYAFLFSPIHAPCPAHPSYCMIYVMGQCFCKMNSFGVVMQLKPRLNLPICTKTNFVQCGSAVNCIGNRRIVSGMKM
jgi:hypothetical protein